MREKLAALRDMALRAVNGAGDTKILEELRVRFLGKKGELTAILKQMGALSAEERPIIGEIANSLRQELENMLAAAAEKLSARELDNRIAAETIDISLPLPLKRRRDGRRHPMGIVLDEVTDMFTGMGFRVAEGPEIELCSYCFDMLNTPPEHPARDRQDTLYISDDVVLRTQTSSVQIRVMENSKPPVRIISPGRVFRKDEVDSTHSPCFHQIEGLVVDEHITFGDLKGTLEAVMRGIYGSGTNVRFRPHHFPYTEPSAEVDLQCFNCHGKGCSMCKGEGWIELLGSGMVHPRVLRGCGIDPEIYSGFAFGIGLERITMGRFGIRDMRLLYENDERFLRQFGGIV